MLKALFRTSFSDASEASRAKEEESYIFFSDFLDSCEGIYFKILYIYIYIVIAGESICKLEDVLIFCTGSDCVPPLGFHKKIDLVFLGPRELLPTASTCSLIMRIPTCLENSNLFNEKMELGLKGGQMFGSV